MHLYKRFIFGLLVVSTQVFATDIAWMKLSPNFTYKDISTACSTENFPRTLYFGAEVNSGQVTKAVLKDSLSAIFSNQIYFLPTEIASTQFYQDSYGRLWLEKFSLSTRLLDWLFKNAGNVLGECKPSQPLLSIAPSPFTFIFDTKELGETLLYSATKNETFKGQRKDGGAYIATLQFNQELLNLSLNH